MLNTAANLAKRFEARASSKTGGGNSLMAAPVFFHETDAISHPPLLSRIILFGNCSH
jgi:hypothetical protein